MANDRIGWGKRVKWWGVVGAVEVLLDMIRRREKKEEWREGTWEKACDEGLQHATDSSALQDSAIWFEEETTKDKNTSKMLNHSATRLQATLLRWNDRTYKKPCRNLSGYITTATRRTQQIRRDVNHNIKSTIRPRIFLTLTQLHHTHLRRTWRMQWVWQCCT